MLQEEEEDMECVPAGEANTPTTVATAAAKDGPLAGGHGAVVPSETGAGAAASSVVGAAVPTSVVTSLPGGKGPPQPLMFKINQPMVIKANNKTFLKKAGVGGPKASGIKAKGDEGSSLGPPKRDQATPVENPASSSGVEPHQGWSSRVVN